MDKLKDNLTGSLEEAEAKIALLNAAVNPDFDKDYSLGDTVTVKSNGVPLYKVKLVSYGIGDYDVYSLTGEVTNINMPRSTIKAYFNAYGYDCNAERPTFFFLGKLSGSTIEPYFGKTAYFSTSLTGNVTGEHTITHIVVGIPNTVDVFIR